MKKNLYLILLLGAMLSGRLGADCCSPSDCCSPCDTIVDVSCNACECKATSQTFFSVRPKFQGASAERLTLFRDRMKAREDGIHGAFQAVLFGGRSTHEGRMAAFFGPSCKSVFNVTEGDTLTNDILSNNFNVYTVDGNFESNICFAPRQSYVGLGLDYKQAFASCCNGNAFWFEFTMPIYHVKNTMGFAENVIEAGGGAAALAPIGAGVDDPSVPQAPVANMTEAFKQSIWKFGKIDNDACSCMSATRIADIDLRVGYEIVTEETCYYESYVGLNIPTGNSVKGEYVFEPIVGHNRNFGAMMGSNLGYEVWSNREHTTTIWFEFTLHALYLFQNKQCRLLDLKCKPWSRYQQMYASLAQAQQAFDNEDNYLQTPGVNIMGQRVCVSPGFERTYNAGFVLNHGGFEGEIGYDFYYRSPECVKLANPWVQGPALKAECYPICVGSEPDLDCETGGVTNSVQTIGNLYGSLNSLPFSVDNYGLNMITADQIDLDSAAHPAMCTHTAYGSLGYRWDDYEFPWFLGLGGSYEFSRDNTGQNRWLLWSKVGLSF